MKEITKVTWYKSIVPYRFHTNKRLFIHDILLISIMMVLAGCGIIYEFLLSHYAARVLGATEVAIFGVFTIMIASMGIGAFAAKHLSCPFNGFVRLEILIAFTGVTAILISAAGISFTHILPALLADTYGFSGINPSGGFINAIRNLAQVSPFIFAFILGVLIGAEIPLIARIREDVYGRHLENNIGTIYGADYIGAGIGATVFVFFLLTLDVTTASVIAAFVNLIAGIVFFVYYKDKIRIKSLIIIAHVLVGIIIAVVLYYGSHWQMNMEDMLYKDKVVHSMNTKYQHVVITKRVMNPDEPSIYSLHINGHTQFSSRDEYIYHSMLVYPAMLASARHDNVLIIGGGDGLALRDVLKWNPKQVVLIDLDAQLVQFFTAPLNNDGATPINLPLLELNNWSFSDSRVDVRIGDAFSAIDSLLNNRNIFDTIIVDLPDPNHPDLNKLYSARFYAKLYHLLSGDGAISVQSTSPYHAKEAFISIGKTIKHAGFANLEQYHANVPSFGEWGWSIATKTGKLASARIAGVSSLPVDDQWVTKSLLLSSFAFSKDFFDISEQININRLGSNVVYQYHYIGWAREYNVLY